MEKEEIAQNLTVTKKKNPKDRVNQSGTSTHTRKVNTLLCTFDHKRLSKHVGDVIYIYKTQQCA